MDTGLKQRLIGAAVLVALAVIFLPMLVKGPAPDSGVSSVSLDMPDAPDGATETRELPLVTPGDVPKGGALGMDARPVDMTAAPVAPTDPAAATGVAGTPGADPAAATAPAPDATASGLPPTTAGGDFAVHFGAYASEKGAQTVADLARKAQLPAYTEAATVNGKPAWRVRIGPYATRADAEAARLKAVDVRADVPVRVISLDAEAAAAAKAAEQAALAAAQPATPPTAKPETRPAPAVETTPKKPVPTSAPTTARVETRPQPTVPPAKPTTTKPADKQVAVKPSPAPAKPTAPAASKVGFAVQAGAFSDAAEAVALRDRLRGAGFSAFVETVNTDKGPLTRVRVGPVVDRAAADQLKAQVQSKTGVEGFVRPHP